MSSCKFTIVEKIIDQCFFAVVVCLFFVVVCCCVFLGGGFYIKYFRRQLIKKECASLKKEREREGNSGALIPIIDEAAVFCHNI